MQRVPTPDPGGRQSDWRLVCFDLDGTLIRGTTVCQHLGDFFGYGYLARELAAKHSEGRIGFRELAERDAEFYRGRNIRDVAVALETLPLIGGAQATMSRLRASGIKVLLTTITWSFAARLIAKRLGLDGSTGCTMGETKEGILSGSLECCFDEYEKRRFVERYCFIEGLPLGNVVAIGDSITDIPLFEVVGYSIALNATEAVGQRASCSVETENLLDVFQFIPGLCCTAHEK
jgi:phosphoserine phosphatase